MTIYTFTHKNEGDYGSSFPKAKYITQTLEFHDEVLWTTVVDEFLLFLGSVYGYDIRDQVEYLSFEEKLQAVNKKYNLDHDEDE